ncbi:hypothetical protein KFK09_000260 [Dendrobium nobile]|uniref:BED-type domain-containing protein n=1 Tax=Dendrobium nobile TaxID=94219 RepID=A0A8T3CBC9_DENNO|nr:hypothetical protein KFK09_000260 [Dendrobium nobile]
MEDSNTIIASNPSDHNEHIPTDNEQEYDSDELNNASGSGIAQKKKRRLTSNVWGHFEMLPLAKDGKQRCKCKKCGATYLSDSKNGTGNLRRHLQNCKKRSSQDIGQLILQSNSSASMSVVENKFDNQEFRSLFTACIIMHDLPFQCVEWAGLRSLLRYLRPDLHIVSRNTARQDCKKMFVKEKVQIQSLLSSCKGRVSLTSDLWTSINTDGFICLTAHFIDKNWRLQKKVINFGFMPPPHDGLALFEKLQLFLNEWKLDSKLFSITLDNASANTVSVDFLRNHLNLKHGLLCNGEFFHMRCCAHIVNLIVQEGLKEIDSCVLKVRESIKYVKGSQLRKQKFLDCVRQSFLESTKGLRQDVPTRWNSTFVMLDSAIYFRRAFMHLELGDSNYKCCPSASEWEKCVNICKFLAPFYEITCLFSGSKYPTANLYFPCVSTAYASLKNEMSSDLEYIRRMTVGMLAKFEKYWKDFSVLLAIAVILDPRYKFNFVEWCYKKLYTGTYIIELDKVKEKLESLFANYSRPIEDTSTSETQTSQSSQKTPSTTQSTTMIKSQFLQDYDTFEVEVTMPRNRKSELEVYLDETKLDRNSELDILQYWKLNQYRFPQVSSMARDVLCIPISTVASESAFSNSGRVLDQYRSALKHDIVEALVCTKDWLYSEQDAKDTELDAVTDDIMGFSWYLGYIADGIGPLAVWDSGSVGLVVLVLVLDRWCWWTHGLLDSWLVACYHSAVVGLLSFCYLAFETLSLD